MSAALRFVKYEGLGNDFVVVDGIAKDWLTAVPRLCDRHFGIGADGVLFVEPPRTPGARAAMVVINADGSRPEMCGNGLRCVALHIAMAELATSDRAEVIVDTDAGPRRCSVDASGDTTFVTTELGRARGVGELTATLPGGPRTFVQVDIGNPHAIAFDVPLETSVIDEVSPRISAGQPHGTNVEFVQQRADGSLDLVVWERGVGRTLACGTGAGATAFAAVLAQRAARQVPVSVRLPGGLLEITVGEDDSVIMRGPARRVFAGETSGA